MEKKRTPFRIEWDAHEYEHKERSHDWFWAVWVLALAVAVAAVVLGNIIFGILVLTSVFALTLFANRPPESVHVIVNEKGITRDNVLYPYETLDSYWLDSDHPHPKMILCSKKPFLPLIVIPMGKDIDVYKLDETIAEFLEEKYHPLPFVERLIDYLGF